MILENATTRPYVPEPIKGTSIPESAIVSACIKWLWANGCYVWRQNTGGMRKEYTRKNGSRGISHIRFGPKGCADILGVTASGKFIAIECKTESGKLSPDQILFRDRIREKNGIWILARSVDDLEGRKKLICS